MSGSLSDHIIPTPVIGAGVMILGASMIISWHAGSVEASSALVWCRGIAAIVDLDPPNRPASAVVSNTVIPLAGLAFGASSLGWLWVLTRSPAAGTRTDPG